jgi:hypothetical protein
MTAPIKLRGFGGARLPARQDQPTPAIMKANTAAFQACHRLVFAYQQGKRTGSSVNWAHIDAAYETAMEALRLQREAGK